LDSKAIGIITRFESTLTNAEIGSLERKILRECRDGKINDYPIEYQGIIESLKYRMALRCGFQISGNEICRYETLKTTEYGKQVLAMLKDSS